MTSKYPLKWKSGEMVPDNKLGFLVGIRNDLSGDHRSNGSEVGSDKPKSKKVQIVLDEVGFERLISLQSYLDASTVGEVVRRALWLLDGIIPDDLELEANIQGLLRQADNVEANRSSRGRSMRITASLSITSIEKMKSLASDFGVSQSEVVRHGLRVLATVVSAKQTGKPLNAVDASGKETQLRPEILLA